MDGLLNGYWCPFLSSARRRVDRASPAVDATLSRNPQVSGRLSQRSAILSLLIAPGVFAEAGQVVGVVLSVAGRVYMRSSSGSEILLNPSRDVPKVIVEGESLRCGRASKMRVWIEGETRTITTRDGVFRPRVDRPLTPFQKKIVEALNEYGRPGGSRGIESFIWSPPSGGAVRATSLKIRWTPVNAHGPFHLTVFKDSGNPVWTFDGADIADGRISPEGENALRLVLGELQTEKNPRAVTLDIESNDQGQSQVTFWVLSRQAEERLDKQLQRWNDESDPLLRAIVRAHTLSSALLYADAAEEFERALILAPESDSLLAAALDANLRTGNYIRAHNLREKIRAAR